MALQGDERRTPGDVADFGSMLKVRRLAAGLSQEELAERSRIGVDTISALERGVRRAPYRATIEALSDALDLSSDDRALFHAAASRRKRAQTGFLVQSGRLPAYGTRFIGRAADREAVADLLCRFRAVTISGPGGIGKTRLAVETVREVKAQFAAAFFIDLAGIRDPAHVLPAVAAVSGVRPSSRMSTETIVEAIGKRAVLFVLDNCEHLIETCARLTADFVRLTPAITVLATSRRPLLIDGEALYRLEPLDIEAASVELFRDRAALVRPDAAERLHDDTLVAICRQLEGFPLAIELVAARTRVQSTEDIAVALEDDDFLPGEMRRSSVEQHRTMESAIAWSYNLLTPDEREALELIAFLGAGCSFDAARALIGPHASSLTAALIDASVLVEDRPARRLRLHGATRRFVRSRTSPHTDARARQRYAAWIGARLREAAEDSSCNGNHAAFDPLIAELDNVRRLLTVSLEARDVESAFAALNPDFWYAVHRLNEGHMWFTRLREELLPEHDPRGAYLDVTIALMAARTPADGIAESTRALAAAEASGSDELIGLALFALAMWYRRAAQAITAIPLLERAAAIFERLGRRGDQSTALIGLAEALIDAQEFDRAPDVLERAGAMQTERFDSCGRTAIAALGSELAVARGDHARAVTLARRAMVLSEERCGFSWTWNASIQFVTAAALAGEIEEAAAVSCSIVDEIASIGSASDLLRLIDRMALIAVRSGNPAAASKLTSFVDAAIEQTGVPRTPTDTRIRTDIEAALEDALDPEARKDLARAGAVLTPAIAIETALAAVG